MSIPNDIVEIRRLKYLNRHHIIPNHIIPNHIIPNHIIPNHIVSNHIVHKPWVYEQVRAIHQIKYLKYRYKQTDKQNDKQNDKRMKSLNTHYRSRSPSPSTALNRRFKKLNFNQ